MAEEQADPRETATLDEIRSIKRSPPLKSKQTLMVLGNTLIKPPLIDVFVNLFIFLGRLEIEVVSPVTEIARNHKQSVVIVEVFR